MQVVRTPSGCEAATKISLTWRTYDTGTYRLFSSAAEGYHSGFRHTTLKTARALITGERCV